MRIVVALGGNAFLGRGEPPTFETHRYHAKRAARALSTLAQCHDLLITHGNGPQVGMLAMLAADAGVEAYPLDVLGAESEGMIGYLLEQELANELPRARIATLLTRTVVRGDDAADRVHTKRVGPLFAQGDAERLAASRRWQLAAEGRGWRRVVPSPEPADIVELPAIEHLARAGFLVICAGGGGVPVRRSDAGHLEGVEGVVDKDLTAALLANRLGADCLMLLTDVPAVFDGWGTERARRIRSAHPDALAQFDFAADSMGLKVEAARRFALHTRGAAYIGALGDAAALLECHAGTRISVDVGGVAFA